MVEMDMIKSLLNKNVHLIWGEKERIGKITKINEESNTFNYLYNLEEYSEGMGGTAHIREIIEIQGNKVIFSHI